MNTVKTVNMDRMDRIKIKTRFAPSPTGDLHLGGARTALFAYLYAKHHQGEFALRVEDTDLERSTEQAKKAILKGMHWLGLTSDEPVVYQTERFDRYMEEIQRLLSEDKAYRCYCSKERLDLLRQQQLVNKQKPKYDGKCRDLISSDMNGSYVIRFKSPESGIVQWEDAVKGSISIANVELDDMIIARSDGSPTYNFCVVVDDHDMAITHVIRGDDHINNTPKQINLYHALGYGHVLPVFAHLPMILGEDGKKLSKRHAAVNVMAYHEMGYLPEAMLNYLARLGWACGDQELFSMNELIHQFDLSDVNASPSMFSLDKLNWVNQQHMKSMPVKLLADKLREYFEAVNVSLNEGPDLEALIPVVVEKVKTLKAFVEYSRFFYEPVKIYDAVVVKKFIKSNVVEIFKMLLDGFSQIRDWDDPRKLHDEVKSVASHLSLGMGKVGMPLRIALTGASVSPDIGVTLFLFGKKEVLNRLKSAQNYFSSTSL